MYKIKVKELIMLLIEVIFSIQKNIKFYFEKSKDEVFIQIPFIALTISKKYIKEYKNN